MDEIDQLATTSGMPIPPEFRDSVLRQWRLNQALAAPLLAFDLPDSILPAPVFTP
jgi:hypothetical protein